METTAVYWGYIWGSYMAIKGFWLRIPPSCQGPAQHFPPMGNSMCKLTSGISF